MRSINLGISRVLLCLTLPTVLLTAPVVGQDLPRIRLGAGAAMRGDYLAGWGVHGTLEFSASPGSRFDLRAGGSFAGGGFSPAGAVFGMDVLGVVAFGSANRPYLGLGVGYSHTDASSLEPFAYDLGVSVAVGFEWHRDTTTWFIEARTRAFGNVFYERAATQSVFLLSLGRAIG